MTNDWFGNVVYQLFKIFCQYPDHGTLKTILWLFEKHITSTSPAEPDILHCCALSLLLIVAMFISFLLCQKICLQTNTQQSNQYFIFRLFGLPDVRAAHRRFSRSLLFISEECQISRREKQREGRRSKRERIKADRHRQRERETETDG